MPSLLGNQSNRHLKQGAAEQAPLYRYFLCLLLALPWAADAENAGPDPSLRTTISEHLVRPDGAGFVAYRWQREPAIVALYFGADWCGPCHAFVPTLRDIREALHEAGADTEVVYVSLDTSEADMRRAMQRQRMPWPAIDHRRLRALPAIRALGGIAPPNLVLIDREGRVLASGWQGRRYPGLHPVLDAWLQAFAAGAAARDTDAVDTFPLPATEESAR